MTQHLFFWSFIPEKKGLLLTKVPVCEFFYNSPKLGTTQMSLTGGWLNKLY